MEKLPLLDRRVNELVKEVVKLKRENEQLRSEVEFVQGDKSRAQKAIKENKLMSDEKSQIKKKVQRILDIFEKLNV